MKKILYYNRKGILLPAKEVIEKLRSKFDAVKDKQIHWLSTRESYVQVRFTGDKVETNKEHIIIKDVPASDGRLFLKKDHFAQIFNLKHKFNHTELLFLENGRLKNAGSIPDGEAGIGSECNDYYFFICFDEHRTGEPFSEIEEI